MQPIYGFFAATEGFGEFCIVVSLTAIIVLAFLGKLTDSFAAALTAMNIGGIAHDQMTTWQQRWRDKHDNQNSEN